MTSKKEVKKGNVKKVSSGPAFFDVPDMETVTPIGSIVGKKIPPSISLHQHSEFNSMVFTCTNAVIASGLIDAMKGEYIIAYGFIHPPGVQINFEEHAVKLVTANGDIFDKIILALEGEHLPVSGTFRKLGRSWLWL